MPVKEFIYLACTILLTLLIGAGVYLLFLIYVAISDPGAVPQIHDHPPGVIESPETRELIERSKKYQEESDRLEKELEEEILRDKMKKEGVPPVKLPMN